MATREGRLGPGGGLRSSRAIVTLFRRAAEGAAAGAATGAAAGAANRAATGADRRTCVTPTHFPEIQLRPGTRADLLLLSSDPRSDLSALERPLGVMVRGEWYAAEALEDLREGVKSAYAP